MNNYVCAFVNLYNQSKPISSFDL